ncbi:MAG: InlB B-repeat-containing protein [Treponema sp.]|jgi:uncharacterized repeat protein (TIGR02543 family)|nr:InlB B-repeat-containing protein [Treponema sp.]
MKYFTLSVSSLAAVFCLLFAACSLGTDIEELRDRVRERERRTVAFDANGATGGTAPDAVSASQNTDITLPGQGNLVKAGYAFAGWNTAADGSGITYAAGSSYTVTGNATLYARWMPAGLLTVTFNANGATGGTAPYHINASQNTAITLPNQGSLVKAGYAFAGWNTAADGSGMTYAAGSSYMVTGYITLYAKWNTPGMFTVIFDVNNASGNAPDAQTVSEGSIITLPGGGAFSKPGHTFGGWNADAEGSGTTYAAGSTYIIAANLTLYAKWNINNYTVTFDINGAGGTAPTTQTADYSTDITLPNNSSFSKPGYAFGGWNENADSSGETYTPDSSFTVTGDTTLYAKWEYTVTFNANGATGGTAPDAMSANQNASITLPDKGSLVKTGYAFTGWNTAANGSGTTYAVGSTYTVTGNVTLYAKWNVDIIGMVWINPGTFTMGGISYVSYGVKKEETPHQVTLTSGFYMGKYEVTQEQYQVVMGNNPSYFDGIYSLNERKDTPEGEIQSRRPVEMVNWYDAIVFCNKLSMIEGLTAAYRINGSTDTADWGTVPNMEADATWDAVQVVAGSTGYRLPTEAQWEYACRAGTTTTWSFGDNESDLTNYAWYGDNSNYMTHEVGKKLPNAWGLYDMYGNVYEWCWDRSGDYPTTAQTDPTGASYSLGRYHRMRRGGDFYSRANIAVSAWRNSFQPELSSDIFGSHGFRLVRP